MSAQPIPLDPGAPVGPHGPAARTPRRAGGTRRAQRGISLIIAMLMLALIGLASAAIMRNATSADQVATNNRLQTQANQYAQLALRFCENQLTLAPAARTVELFSAATPGAWSARARWTRGGGPGAHRLSASDIGGPVQPRVAPQCLVEEAGIPGVFTVTARGFSPDFRADAKTGATRSGAVVWLQSTVLTAGGGGPPPAIGATSNAGRDETGPPRDGASGCGGACAMTIRQRLWQQLLTPPF